MITKLVKVKIFAVLDWRWHWQWKPCGDAQVSRVCLTGILLKTKSIKIWSKTLNLLTKITRVWVQDGKVIPNAMTNMPGASFPNDIQTWRTWQICQVLPFQMIFKHNKYARHIFGKYHSKSTLVKHKTKHITNQNVSTLLTSTALEEKIVQVSTRLTPSQTTFAVRPRYDVQPTIPEHNN